MKADIYVSLSSYQVKDAFQEAMRTFTVDMSNDSGKCAWLSDPKHANMEAVLASVAEAGETYKTKRGSSRAQEALIDLSERVHLYSGILDVIVQHHPEYTALVWGAMKLLFTVR